MSWHREINFPPFNFSANDTMDGRTDERTHGRTDERTNGQTIKCFSLGISIAIPEVGYIVFKRRDKLIGALNAHPIVN